MENDCIPNNYLVKVFKNQLLKQLKIICKNNQNTGLFVCLIMNICFDYIN